MKTNSEEIERLKAENHNLQDALIACDWLCRVWTTRPQQGEFAQAFSDVMQTARKMRDAEYEKRITELTAVVADLLDRLGKKGPL